ncbi:DUF1360 domain-containing protein [Anoxybacteroides tepidamans]|uniref:DUF1360 domain-containing protein n=1 Tax=Anoxybacteroides tepidamans TaxID=265948 RepID=UPI000482DC37|nr:DUF1360 domain-containing protein [Anoxybacillus tepidamans]
MDRLFDLLLLSLASFRFTRLLVYDAIMAWLRKPFHDIVEETLPDGSTETFLIVKGSGIKHWIGELLSCYWCTGVWCAAFFYGGYMLFPSFFGPLVHIFAIAGCAALIETIVSKFLNT